MWQDGRIIVIAIGTSLLGADDTYHWVAYTTLTITRNDANISFHSNVNILRRISNKRISLNDSLDNKHQIPCSVG